MVNSTSDLPDLAPGDGKCFTGGKNIIGQDECTMRAAIQEANALPGRDSIKFNIPLVPGIPVIRLELPLPAVTEPVVINAATQPGVGWVELDGSLLGPGRDGLTILAGKSAVRNLLINRFTGNGLVLMTGDSNSIERTVIGADTSGAEDRGNFFAGVRIDNSSANEIGGPLFQNSNTIAFNDGPGIFVASGGSNRIQRNSIHSNGGLGIDLAPIGVTPNDSADADTGANGLVNFPVIDSIDATVPGQITIYGYQAGAPNQTFTLEFFSNDSCDPSGYGEGKTSVWREGIITNPSGKAGFQVTFPFPSAPGSNQPFAVLATDFEGNTSEFSTCGPAKWLEIVDAFDYPIPNTYFRFQRVQNDRPNFTETFLDSLQTTSSGRVELRILELEKGDSVKVDRLLQTEPRAKSSGVIGSKYSIHLDNAKLDSTGVLSYDEVRDTSVQKIVMDHTVVAYNLLVSIEWDSELDYLQSTMTGFRHMSDYLFDVTDGQARFDTIALFDNGLHWNQADMWVFANNMVWPHVKGLSGLHNPTVFVPTPVHQPRRWHGDSDPSRNHTYTQFPMDLTDPQEYRTRMHELGHYALGFGDEYDFRPLPDSVRCATTPNYGFMDFHYPNGGERATEMSSSSAYSDSACRNNHHWKTNGASCWQRFEAQFEKNYGGLWAPILRPEERMLKTGFDYLPGPNDNPAQLDFNAGSRVVFPAAHSTPLGATRIVEVQDPATGNRVPKAPVTLVRGSLSIDQGKTADNGFLRALDVRPGDTLQAAGRRTIVTGGNRLVAALAEEWLYGKSGTISGGSDTVSLSVQAVKGDYPLVCKAALTAGSLNLNLDAAKLFSANPTVGLQPYLGPKTSHSFLPAGNGYTASISDSLGSSGALTLRALDDSGNAFFFPAYYTTENFDTGLGRFEMTGYFGQSKMVVDSATQPVERIFLLSTEYPVIRTGLNPQSRQGGMAQAMTVFPADALTGGTQTLTIRYAESDLEGDNTVFNEETSLRMFQWNGGQLRWELIGGSVDTGFNEVTASIGGLGVYAAFTIAVPTDVEDEGRGSVIPKQFELSQNYPNPFNPATTIRFSLPVRSNVRLDIYNILGQKVRTLVNEEKAAGFHTVVWDGRDGRGNELASGVYLFKIVAGEFIQSKKMLLVK